MENEKMEATAEDKKQVQSQEPVNNPEWGTEVPKEYDCILL